MSLRDGPFHPLRIEAVPCDPDIVRQHLEAFLRAFVRSDSRSRAEHILFRLAPRQPDRLKDLGKLLDERYTSPPRDLQLPGSLPTAGIYYCGGSDAWRLSFDDAELASTYLGRDAVWSAVAGRYAAFFHHENLRWICHRSGAALETAMRRE